MCVMESWLLPGDEDEKSLDQTQYLKLPVACPKEIVMTLTKEVEDGGNPRPSERHLSRNCRLCAGWRPGPASTLRPEHLTASWQGWVLRIWVIGGGSEMSPFGDI